YFRQRQQQGAFDLIAVTDPQGFQISAPAPLPQSYANVPGNESLFANVIYTNDDLFGGFLKLQGYYRENEFINPGSDIRAAPLPPWFPGLWQTGQDANEIGVRAEYTRDFFDMVEITVGGDYTREDYFNTLLITDPTNFNTTGFFDGSTETFQSPPNVLTSYGAFLQAQVEVTDEMSVSGGVRYDTFSFSLDPYDVVFDFPIQAGVRQGGDGGADGFTFNFGGTYAVTDDVTVFANFGQGFLIPAVGFAANQVQPGVPLGLADALEPIKTTSYDIGVRGTEGPVDFALAGFFSSSELGDNLTLGQAGIGQRVRSPQRNYGFEVALNWRATEDLTLGTTITWNDGEFDANDTGNFTAINSLFVDPIKITANADYQVTENLNLFASLFHVGNRTRAFEQGTDRNPPDSYTLVDVGAGYVLGDFDLGLQVTNLFNEDYASVFQSTFIPGRRRSGPGRAVWLSAAYNFEH
ncbi:MAG: TonB-dependent receptor, partial [Pseudomonadota bacterium]